jgi:hypothetical protein
MSEPRFDSVICGHENIYDIITCARLAMRKIGLPKAEIEKMTKDAISAPSYREARAVVERYFRIKPPLGAEE